ncbi:D-tyrosyl-tRNA(Tyr) deacylase [Salipaludibacillus neizhouensis]|uniref:D-aminoacyl-tRNA deacylase n=1 Tax=Salipaludibacillus neizhouensis TaxID=885475 RepID=A0A3A9KG82_9BACI|nr:D-aminoacyl-tRNA deacylase [Salipaludibacillus neizhouensis]RKL68573.1 D-tyrosyl-tRNA(Tyr) deacylase [Salipaludibacillus neizhouensis]
MRVVVQRSLKANVTVNDEVTGAINHGYVLLVAVTHEDTKEDAYYVADKIAKLRLFEDEHGKLNLSIQEVEGQILSISQFTLYGDSRKGRRPNFKAAAKPVQAKELYDLFNERLQSEHDLQVETGIFGEMMNVSLLNHGPITLIVESK